MSRVSMAPIVKAFGLEATIEPKWGNKTTASVIWLSELREETPVGRDYNRREPRRLMGIPRSELGTITRGTVIAVPRVKGGAVERWQVDAIDATDIDEFKVIVIPEAERVST